MYKYLVPFTTTLTTFSLITWKNTLQFCVFPKASYDKLMQMQGNRTIFFKRERDQSNDLEPAMEFFIRKTNKYDL